MKAVLLISGGLDSILAGKLMIEAGIEVFAFHVITPFSSVFQKECNAEKTAQELCIPIHFFKTQEDYLRLIEKPKYGWGKGINPCIDCKIYFLKKAKEYADKIGASFFITGEVLGQRPKSQYLQALKIIEKNARLEGLIVRPLSAKLLPLTIPEKEGWVKRENLLAISGRSRKEQFELALKFGLKSYSMPAGGCLLTDIKFSKRAREAMKNNEWQPEMISLLKIGRHFRLPDGNKLVIGRNEKENELLNKEALKLKAITFELIDYPSPLGVLIRNSAASSSSNEENGIFEKSFLELPAKIVIKYSDLTKCKILPKVCKIQIINGEGRSEVKGIKNFFITPEEIDKYRI